MLLWAGSAFAADTIVAVPTVTLYPGDVIAEAQIVERPFGANALGKLPIIADRALLIGKVARRTLLPGKPILANSVKDPDVISRGGTILAVYRAGGLTITSVVAPLRAGGVGDIIEARNLDSGQIIRGQVQADGTLRVGFAK